MSPVADPNSSSSSSIGQELFPKQNVCRRLCFDALTTSSRHFEPVTSLRSDTDFTNINCGGSCHRLLDVSTTSSEDFRSAVERRYLEVGRRRWNFDFPSGLPLSGRYEWVPVISRTLAKFGRGEVEPSTPPRQASSIFHRIVELKPPTVGDDESTTVGQRPISSVSPVGVGDVRDDDDGVKFASRCRRRKSSALDAEIERHHSSTISEFFPCKKRKIQPALRF